MTTLLKNTIIVNEGSQSPSDLRIKNGRIELIAAHIQAKPSDQVIDAQGCLLLPGMIDDQVHFREPGLVHKGCIATESRAAVAGGITSYMEMPNVKPSTTTAQALDDKKISPSKTLSRTMPFILAQPKTILRISNDSIRRRCVA